MISMEPNRLLSLNSEPYNKVKERGIHTRVQNQGPTLQDKYFPSTRAKFSHHLAWASVGLSVGTMIYISSPVTNTIHFLSFDSLGKRMRVKTLTWDAKTAQLT